LSFSTTLDRIQESIHKAQNKAGLFHHVEIVAVTKTHPIETIIKAAAGGIRSIGENKVQEAADKFFLIPEDIRPLKKRMIGHLQSNKISKCLKLFDTVDSVDSLVLAKKIGRKAQNKNTQVLLEVNTSGEQQKGGFSPDDIDNMIQCMDIPNIAVKGLMTVGPLSSDKSKIRDSFVLLRKTQTRLNSQIADKKLTELSMGMSRDYRIAVEEGSTMVRLGTILFGPR
jgi:hypothetical protein